VGPGYFLWGNGLQDVRVRSKDNLFQRIVRARDEMKYGIARFVYGLAAVVLMLLGLALAIPVSSDRKPTASKDTGNHVAVGIIAGSIPFALGIACLFRRRHWQRAAHQREMKPEQSAASLPSAPRTGPSEDAR